MQTLDELGYEVADAAHTGADDPKVIDGRYFLPQHRERIVLVGFRRDLQLHEGFTLRDIAALYPTRRPTFGELLEPAVDDKFILTRVLWKYLYRYARKHQERGTVLATGSSTQRIRTAWRERSLPAITKMARKSSLIGAGIGLWAKSILMTLKTSFVVRAG
jgi:site-specific DNA-cytosine methylase